MPNLTTRYISNQSKDHFILQCDRSHKAADPMEKMFVISVFFTINKLIQVFSFIKIRITILPTWQTWILNVFCPWFNTCSPVFQHAAFTLLFLWHRQTFCGNVILSFQTACVFPILTDLLLYYKFLCFHHGNLGDFRVARWLCFHTQEIQCCGTIMVRSLKDWTRP